MHCRQPHALHHDQVPPVSEASMCATETNACRTVPFVPRHTELDQSSRNNKKNWQAGANTLAHELGHYLGLLHTHAGSCNGDTAGVGDGVADTPVCKEFSYFVSNMSGDLSTKLTGWCADFRRGKQPDVALLEQFNSCPEPTAGQPAADQSLDPVFNLMGYNPDSCAMDVTPGQVQRLQMMVARYRPNMVAAYRTV